MHARAAWQPAVCEITIEQPETLLVP